MTTPQKMFCLSLLFTLHQASIIRGQFSDIAAELAITELPKTGHLNGQFYLENQASNYGNLGIIEGVCILIDSEVAPKVNFRFKSEQGWSPWLEGSIFAEPLSSRSYATSTSKHVVNSVEFQYRVQVQQGRATVLKAGVFQADTEYIPPWGRLAPEITERIQKPEIITRSAWGAKSPKSSYTAHSVYDRLTVHHAAGFRASTYSEAVMQVQAIQRLHQDVRGWNDIGYHFIIDAQGIIFQGRPEYAVGAHVGGANDGNIGVSLLGCFHPPTANCNDQPTPAALQSLSALFAWLATAYGYQTPAILKGHRDYFGNTTCPGDNIWNLLPQLRNNIITYIDRETVPASFSLEQNFPNPFTGRVNSTKIVLNLAQSEFVTLEIFNILGQRVRTLLSSSQPPGSIEIIWDGKNSAGVPAPNGIYYYKAVSGTRTESRRLVLLR